MQLSEAWAGPPAPPASREVLLSVNFPKLVFLIYNLTINKFHWNNCTLQTEEKKRLHVLHETLLPYF